MWREVASRLGMGALASDPLEAAEAISHAAQLRRAIVVAAIPLPGTWDRAVAVEMASFAPCAPVVLLAAGMDATDDVAADVYEIAAVLDRAERARWWAALADAARDELRWDAISQLDGWWSNARNAPPSREPAEAAIAPAAERLLGILGLAARAWPTERVTTLGADDAALDELVRVGAVRASGGWVCVEAAWDARGKALAQRASERDVETVARGLLQISDDAWALSRGAELLARVGAWNEADEAQLRALRCAEDSLARRELVIRWATAVGTLPAPAQLPLRVNAAEEALERGEAEEAFRWAQSAAALAPQDARVTLLFGRAAVALGDLVAAKVALERGARSAPDDASRAIVAADLAEVAYLGGDMEAAAREAGRALSLDHAAATTLKARNTLGKILLANSSWDEADVHFAEDAWTAAGAGLPTEELRASSNRGIALLSKGMLDEARAIFEAVLAEGERAGMARACAFALYNLSVVATRQHDYGQALAFAERSLKLRPRIVDRVATAHALGNLAELRRRLGLLDHAEHAVAFGRRALGSGMPPARSALFSLVAARNALMRDNTVEARREVTRALAESEAARAQHAISEAHCVAARIALEDGDLARAAEMLERARALAVTEELRGEVGIVAARLARALGEDSERPAVEALEVARASGKEDLIIEAHSLLAEIYRARGRLETARAHVEDAAALRDRVAATLPIDMRATFLGRLDFAALSKLHAALIDPVLDVDPPSGAVPRMGASTRPQPALPREIIGDDPAIRGLLSAVKKVARSNSTVLIRGESGTGKELVAEAIHSASDRASGPLVTVNCAALVETLLLSELFGHEKGAFTGAIARRRGRFELADGGTLFLDEIGDISPRTQVALLRVLQERTFERVGGTNPIRVDVRVICATHRDLKAMVERGEFREDLYYRLRGITLEVPPLRARLGDLPRISDHLLARIALERGEAQKALSDDAIELLGRHRWPGNVRELENALRASSLFAEGDVITASTLAENVDDLRGASATSQSRPSLAPPAPTPAVAHEPATSEGPIDDDECAGGPLPPVEASATIVAYAQVRAGSTSLPDIKRQIERDCVARALAETKGNITRAAALLGMKRPRLSQLVKQYGLAVVSSEGLS